MVATPLLHIEMMSWYSTFLRTDKNWLETVKLHSLKLVTVKTKLQDVLSTVFFCLKKTLVSGGNNFFFFLIISRWLWRAEGLSQHSCSKWQFLITTSGHKNHTTFGTLTPGRKQHRRSSSKKSQSVFQIRSRSSSMSSRRASEEANRAILMSRARLNWAGKRHKWVKAAANHSITNDRGARRGPAWSDAAGAWASGGLTGGNNGFKRPSVADKQKNTSIMLHCFWRVYRIHKEVVLLSRSDQLRPRHNQG